MNGTLSRREFGKKLASLVSGTTILAQLPACASLTQRTPTAQELANELKNLGVLTDDAPRQAAAADFGQIIHRQPIAVLKPGLPKDIAKMVELANRRGIKVAMRGQGHAMFGQCQVEDGIVIDSSTLNSVRMITFRGSPAIEAGAGALWGQVVDLAYAAKLTPVVNVDPVYLSVGGTISTGGFGGTSWRDGFQTDHVLELEVVTGCGGGGVLSVSAKGGVGFGPFLNGGFEAGVFNNVTAHVEDWFAEGHFGILGLSPEGLKANEGFHAYISPIGAQVTLYRSSRQ